MRFRLAYFTLRCCRFGFVAGWREWVDYCHPREFKRYTKNLWAAPDVNAYLRPTVAVPRTQKTPLIRGPWTGTIGQNTTFNTNKKTTAQGRAAARWLESRRVALVEATHWK